MKKIMISGCLLIAAVLICNFAFADDKDEMANSAGITLKGPAVPHYRENRPVPATVAPRAANTSGNGGTIFENVSLDVIGDLHKPTQPIAGEAYQLLDPLGNVIALIRSGKGIPDNMEGQLFQVIADKISSSSDHPGFMLEEVTSSNVVTPGSVLFSRPADVNGDGVIDASDIAAASSHFGPVHGVDRIYDLNYDGVVDSKDIDIMNAYEGMKASDVYGGCPDVYSDGVVDVRDLIALSDYMGETVNSYNSYDLNGDGKIDEKDMGILMAFYGYGIPVAHKSGETIMPVIEFRNNKIASITVFASDCMTADKYIFNDQGKITGSIHYGAVGSMPSNFMPLVEYNNGKIASITIFDANGKPTDKYMFDANGQITGYLHYDPSISDKMLDGTRTGPSDPIKILLPPQVEPKTDGPVLSGPEGGFKNPIERAVIISPVGTKNSDPSEVIDKIVVIGSAKKDLPAGVSISSTMAGNQNEEAAPTKSK